MKMWLRKTDAAESLFSEDKDVKRILMGLSALSTPAQRIKGM